MQIDPLRAYRLGTALAVGCLVAAYLMAYLPWGVLLHVGLPLLAGKLAYLWRRRGTDLEYYLLLTGTISAFVALVRALS